MIFIHFRKIQHKGQYTFMANWWLGNLVCQLISTSNQSLCICLGHIPLAIFFHLQSESLNQWLIREAVMQSKLTIQDFRYAFRSKFFFNFEIPCKASRFDKKLYSVYFCTWSNVIQGTQKPLDVMYPERIKGSSKLHPSCIEASDL